SANMAETNSTGPSHRTTDWLAWTVVVASFITIFILACVIIVNPWKDEITGLENRARYVFGVLLPMLGTWMGVVLAHYFQRDNLSAATQSITDLARGMSGLEKLKSIPIKDKMRPIGSIKYEPFEAGDESKKNLKGLTTKFGNLERILMLDSKLCLHYLIY